jgi:hypothetical protein
MGIDFFAYIERLELMAFFSGYPFIYLLVHIFSSTQFVKRIFHNRIELLLPVSYALVGLLYLGLLLKNLYPHYSLYNIQLSVHQPFFKIWGLLSILFFIPLFNRKTVFSFWHSLLFFFFFAGAIIKETLMSNQNDAVKNGMHIYSISLLINLFAFIIICIFDFIRSKMKSKPIN